jgi:hypothetical protein
MNYLEAFLKEKTRAEQPHIPTDRTDKTSSVSFVSESPSPPSTSFAPIFPPEKANALGTNRARWNRSVTPDSRNPIIPREVRQKIEAIESDARAKGWPVELLYNVNFWDSPRGLAAVLDEDDQIVEVTPDQIAILKVRRDLLRFRRHVA